MIRLIPLISNRLPIVTESRRSLLVKILAFRLFYLFCMACSAAVIPDHNPGDDVLRFDMRLDNIDGCFCLAGHVCQDNMTINENGQSPSCVRSRESNSLIPISIWKFWLSPLTKWDAARFLHLATDPSVRDPASDCVLGQMSSCDFSSSEQAHAFFPFFPMMIQKFANVSLQLLPLEILPPTFESLVVLCGFFLNFVCLIVAILALYYLTMSILPPATPVKIRQHIASSACFVYGVWNPASVFFATNYSESIFSALTLSGHAAIASSNYVLAIPLWTMASYTRSNGSIHSIWLLQHALAHICQYATCYQASNKRSTLLWKSFIKAISCFAASILILFPIQYHDRQGYHRHCNEIVTTKPTWCTDAMSSPSFSLYRWTQQQHWNVGLFHYYEFKQIPNFLLAAPILVLSILGVVQWIWSSIREYGKGKLPQSISQLLIGWPIHALSDSVDQTLFHGLATQPSSTTSTSSPVEAACLWLLFNPVLLGHFAILAGLTIVGLIIAHVQISTRMICSSSPAIIWLLTYCHLQDQSLRLRQLVAFYSILYMLLGVILHVNFLPWT